VARLFVIGLFERNIDQISKELQLCVVGDESLLKQGGDIFRSLLAD